MTKKLRRGVAMFVSTLTEEVKVRWLKIFRYNIRTAPKVDGNQLLTIPCDEAGLEFLAKFGAYLNPKWKVRARARGKRAGKGEPNYYYTGTHQYDSHLPQNLADWFAVYITNGDRNEVTEERNERWAKWDHEKHEREISELKAKHTTGPAELVQANQLIADLKMELNHKCADCKDGLTLTSASPKWHWERMNFGKHDARTLAPISIPNEAYHIKNEYGVIGIMFNESDANVCVTRSSESPYIGTSPNEEEYEKGYDKGYAQGIAEAQADVISNIHNALRIPRVK